jgi:hypothetical protein
LKISNEKAQERTPAPDGLNKIKAMSEKNLKSAKGQNYLKATEDFLTTPKRF